MDAADREWLSKLTGGEIADARRTTEGGSRATWLVDVDVPGVGRRELVLRRDTGDGPFTGTEFTLEREATVYRALQDTEVPVPRVVAVAADGHAMISERVQGSDDFDSIADPDERAGVIDSFLHELANLHRIDPTTLDLPGFVHPVSAEDNALHHLDAWEHIFDTRVRRPAPLVRFVLGWARRHAPAHVDRSVLCWGDVGSGNFLHLDGQVSALLDWELAHVGDPMDDLAFFMMRTNLLYEGRFGDVNECAKRYSKYAGIELDRDRIEYYRPVVLMRWLIAALAALDNRTNTDMAGFTYLFLTIAVPKWLTVVLVDLLGITPEPVQLPAPAAGTPRSEVVKVLQGELSGGIMPALADPRAARRAMGMALLLDHLHAADTMAGPVEEAELDDLEGLLGHRPETVEAGLHTLDSFVRTAGPEHDEKLLRFFVRQTDRAGAVWPMLAGYLAKPIDPLEI